ncbi:hypothetical protein IWW36_004891 [Coemansia brasiliensis]|uniref:Ribosome biogenesis protein NOP53 n=1 Tax=Coemansia brasiliensis TaxID=2650707 RepID=A0A9W8LX66_9FUNG|nr:hypothetical protein IWW36_004891 [Coemansia brasiliensis]
MSAVAKMPSTEPAKKARTGRKRKTDWRKNINLDDIETGLEEMREEERQGGIIEKRQDSDLFVMDTAGDEKTKARVRHTKGLRLDEILNRRSSVPVPVLGRKLGEERKKRRELYELKKRLNKAAGFVKGQRTASQAIQQSKQPQTLDIWGASDMAESTKKKLKTVVSRKKLPHIATLPAVEVAHPGASYRPSETDHKVLMQKASSEYASELRKADRVKQFSQFRGIQHNDGLNECAETVMKEMVQGDASDGSNPNNSSDEDEETVYGSADEGKPTKKVKEPKRKTRVDRNRERRAHERLYKEHKAKEQKEQLRQLELTKRLEKAVEAEAAEAEKAAQRRREEMQKRAALPRKRIGRNNVPQVPEAVQLTEELAGSLRQLQPETNGFAEVYNSFVKRNIVEPRGLQKQKRKSWKIKTTEKWSYKDFK